MFKKGLLAIAVLITMGFIVSCATQQGPLSPSTTLLGQANSNSSEKPTLNVESYPGDLDQPAVFSFHNTATVPVAMEMNASTLNTSTIQVFYKTSDTEETQLTGISITYNAALNQVSIIPAANWTTDTRYRVLFTTGIMTAAGAPLDGNGNGIAEAAAFDNANAQFALGSPTQGSYTFAALNIIGASLAHDGGSASLLSGNANSITLGTYRRVTITVTFNYDVDQSSVFVGTATLHNNFGFVDDATGVAVSPISVSMTADNQIRGVFTVNPDTRYKLTVMGGVSGVRSEVDTSYSLMRGRLFGGEDTVIEAADKVERFFTTEKLNGDSTAPPTVISVPPDPSATPTPVIAEPTYYGGSDRYWEIEFVAPSLVTPAMDRSTLIASNFQLEATNGTEVYNVAIKAVEIVDDLTVRIHIPDSFYPASGDSTPNVTMRVIVSRNVRDAAGLYLDGNSDGIGGNADDDYRSYTFDNVDSQR